MHARHLLPPELRRIVEGELRDAIGLCRRDDLETLDDAGDRFVLEAGVFAFGLLANDDEVHVGVLGLDAGDGGDFDDAGVEVKAFAHAHVQRLGVVRLGDERRLEDPCGVGRGGCGTGFFKKEIRMRKLSLRTVRF